LNNHELDTWLHMFGELFIVNRNKAQ